MATLSTLATFDDIRRCMRVLCDGAAEQEFLKFLEFERNERLQRLNAVHEAQRLQRELDSSLQSMAELESKLFHARRLLEMETKARREAEHNRHQMEKKICAVADLLKNDTQIKEETKGKLAFLDAYSHRRSGKRVAEGKLGNEINSTGSILSDLSVTYSEDDFLDMKTSKTWKKYRPSGPKKDDSYIGKRRSRLSTENNRRRSAKCLEIGPGDKIVAQTKVTIPQNDDGPIQAESVIEAIPRNHNKENYTESSSVNGREHSPKKTNFTPTAPPLQEVNNKLKTPSNDFKNGIFRPHSFVCKTLLRSDACKHCQKKMRFGSLGCKCRNCNISVHPDCRTSLTLMCVPPSGTKGTPMGGGTVSDYAPLLNPRIPSLIVHCVSEIESRGLNEVGIYRVSGSERDVKALKERFFRSKHSPPLENIDIHVICGCLKDFLRSLREPLIPTNLWKDFSNAVQNMSEKVGESDLYAAIEKLPQANRDTLAFLMQHFQRVACCEQIKMPLSNIAKIFGPTIVGYSSAEPERHDIYMETYIQCSVMEKLLNIPTDYWSQFLNVEMTPRTLSTCEDAVKDLLYATPFKGGTVRKQRKFFGTPPYFNKK